jgi:hypothetical protein
MQVEAYVGEEMVLKDPSIPAPWVLRPRVEDRRRNCPQRSSPHGYLLAAWRMLAWTIPVSFLTPTGWITLLR